MKRNPLLSIYGETVILPPAFEGIEETIPKPGKVPTPHQQKDYDDPIYEELAKLVEKKRQREQPALHKRMKEQEIENLKQLLREHEEERSEDHPTGLTPPDPEVTRETVLTASKLYTLCSKYYDLCCKF